MHYKQVANRWKEKWQTGGRDKCLSAAEPSEVLKVWLIRIPSFCVDDSNSVPNLPLPMKNIGKKAPGSFIHKLYGLRSPNSQPSEMGNLTSHGCANCDKLKGFALICAPSPGPSLQCDQRAGGNQ